MNKQTRRLSTDELTNGLIRTKDFKRYLSGHADSMQVITLQKYLQILLQQKNLKKVDVINRSGIDRTFAYQIFDGSRLPSRDKVIQLAFGFGLDYKETAELLRVARKAALYARLKRQAVIIYCLSHNIHFLEMQYMLMEAGLTPLGQERE